MDLSRCSFIGHLTAKNLPCKTTRHFATRWSEVMRLLSRMSVGVTLRAATFFPISKRGTTDMTQSNGRPLSHGPTEAWELSGFPILVQCSGSRQSTHLHT